MSKNLKLLYSRLPEIVWFRCLLRRPWYFKLLVAFSIRESLAPKCLFVCWLSGKEHMVNKYSWGLCVEDMVNEYN